MNKITLEPVAVVRSPFTDKFGVPRQPGLVPEARATVELLAPYDREEALRGIEAFSHLWLLFLFDRTAKQGWRPMVRPPRLGGNRRVGVFASRSNFRPNPIGLSVVELVGVRREGRRLLLEVRGGDLLDGTPVLDIKPYVPYADCLPGARGGFAPEPPTETLEVIFSEAAADRCTELETARYPELRALIERLLRLDPRPAYRDDATPRDYGMRLYDLDVKWRMEGGRVRVTALEEIAPTPPRWATDSAPSDTPDSPDGSPPR
ncbi:tRNA (N6-threonylcarbamoyladenosine(37)-N6)-methyltransferase TrmO [Endothiovibrio diazotrophicus]